MVGTAVVVLWSLNLTLSQTPQILELPILGENYRPVEIVASTSSPNVQHMYTSIGTNQNNPTSLMVNWDWLYLNSNSLAYTMSTNTDLMIPANTQEYLKYSGDEGVQVKLEVLGYQVNS